MIVVMGHNLDPTNGWGNHAWNYLSQLKLKNIDFVAFVESKNGLNAAQEKFGYDNVEFHQGLIEELDKIESL